MGLFDRFKRKPIDEFVSEARAKGATLLDVRDFGEFENGHIPGAVCIPLNMIDGVAKASFDKGEVLYVYCASGRRSAWACRKLKAAGYTAVLNIGGIKSYRGVLQR